MFGEAQFLWRLWHGCVRSLLLAILKRLNEAELRDRGAEDCILTAFEKLRTTSMGSGGTDVPR